MLHLHEKRTELASKSQFSKDTNLTDSFSTIDSTLSGFSRLNKFLLTFLVFLQIFLLLLRNFPLSGSEHAHVSIYSCESTEPVLEYILLEVPVTLCISVVWQPERW